MLPKGLNIENTALPLEESLRRGFNGDDAFERDNLVSRAQGFVQDVHEIDSPHEIPDDFDEIPIELISLIDR